jgi:dolichol-phosphate mannosyltransferase
MRQGLPGQVLALATWALKFRYARFGIVGASGTVVNMVVLLAAQEFAFRSIQPDRARLYVSLAVAILVATLNNFSWNRLWTWADRQQQAADRGESMPWAAQFVRYAVASWLGIALQYGLTLWLAHFMHYLLANLAAIVVASISNFIANDLWTFRHRPAR